MSQEQGSHGRVVDAAEPTGSASSRTRDESRTADPTTDSADRRGADEQGSGNRLNVFGVGETYLFREYFEDGAVFDALERFYDRHNYRFEVPNEAYPDVEALLSGRGYDPVVVDDPAAFAVVVRKYTDHPEVVFEEAVFQVSTDEHNVFVLTDGAAVERAVQDGATRLTDTPLRMTLSAGPGVGPVTVADVADDR